MDAVPFVFIGAALVLVGGIIWFAVAQDRKRTEAMRTLATTMGFSFTEGMPLDQLEAGCGDLPLFRRGHSRAAKRVLQGKVGALEAWVVDYSYTTGGGKSSQTHHQTVVVFSEAGKGLPAFEMSPENFLHRVAGIFGYQDIDFESNEEFSKAYLLRGEDETAIRMFFGPMILSYLGQAHGWHVEARSGRLAVYREERYTALEALRPYLDDAARVAALFARR